MQNALDLDVHDWVKFQKVKTTIEHTEEEIINLVDMSGGAGTGKSYVIKSILQYGHEVSGHRNFVRVAAPTGNAASLFSGGETLHSMLKIPAEKWFSEPLML